MSQRSLKTHTSIGLLAHVGASRREPRKTPPPNTAKTAPEALRCGIFIIQQAQSGLPHCNGAHGPASSDILPGLC